MLLAWAIRMQQSYRDAERRSSSARLELGDLLGFLAKALHEGKLSGDLAQAS
jgi:hypothetical protein